MLLEQLDRPPGVALDRELEVDRVGAEEHEALGGGMLRQGRVPPCMLTINAASR